MILVSDLKEGAAVQLEGKIHRILEIVRHAGSGQMHGFVELKLKDLRFGHVTTKHVKLTDKLDTVDVAKRPMEYLYHDSEDLVFMDPESYEQIQVPSKFASIDTRFLKEGAIVALEFIGEEPIAIQFPKVVELKVSLTGPGIRDGQDNTMKPATLENGTEIMVPQFIETGDIVRVDTEKIKYVDRVMNRKI
jgi:elongation factor P